jgi:hypothetical protein
MSTLRRIQESATAAVDEALRVCEAAPLGVLEAKAGSLFRDDGAVKLHIIRPCSGRGRGRHVYEADMLQREAAKFAGWPMYLDHETPEQIRANGGQPPSITRLGGEVLESWWDGAVPASGRFGQGAVSAWVMPSPYMEEMIRRFPRQVQASVNTFATGTKPRRSGNVLEHVVEGFVDEGSVDWVTRAGAGGGIDLSVMESWLDSDEATARTVEWLRKHQTAVVEALINPPTNAPTTGEEETVDPKQLLEAIAKLDDDQRKTVVESLLGTDEAADVIADAVDDRLKDVLPPALEKAADAIEESALAKVDERLELRESHSSLLEAAKARLDGEKLADAFSADAWRVISEAEFAPVKPDDKGEGGKTEREVMESVVDAEVKRVKALQEAAGVRPERQRRTAVTGNGGGGDEQLQEHEEHEEEDGREAERLLEGAGIDYALAYNLPTDNNDTPKGGEGE